MSEPTAPRVALGAWLMLLRAQAREQPLRLAAAVLAIALGVALGTAVHLVNAAAVNEFGAATKRLLGEPDLIVRGPPEGFAEDWYARVARDPAVAVASPVLEIRIALAGRRDPLPVLGVDPFLASALQPALLGDLGRGTLELLRPDTIVLSRRAAGELGVHPGDLLRVVVGDELKALRVSGVLAGSTYSQALGIMDIASAQWTLGNLGRLNRIDLRLADGRDAPSLRARLSAELPPGILVLTPGGELERVRTVTRAYRVNLDMLALVSLLTGAFLVFATQSLSVLRRRRSLALLRALGVTRGELQAALMAEGTALGALGALLGVLLGLLGAAAILRWVAADLGNGQLPVLGAHLVASPGALLAYFSIGTCVAGIGGWLPARAAARLAPARALKGGDADHARTGRAGVHAGLALIGAGVAFAFLPPVRGLPVFGYASVAALLFGAVLLVPALTARVLRAVPRGTRPVFATAAAQLTENAAMSTLSLASIIVSFSLMVAMAIMVHSFRESFDHWLLRLLPADLQLREPLGNDTAGLSAADQRRIGALAGVARAEFRRTRQILLDPTRPPVTLIARAADSAEMAAALPLVQALPHALPPTERGAWISEAMLDLYGAKLGDRLDLPLAGRLRSFVVAGVWRDYARSGGAVAITRADYLEATGDQTANEGSLWLSAHADPAVVVSALRAAVPAGAALDILTSGELRRRSLAIFDRAFAITYALEAVAVLIGLAGISLAAGSTALARRAEFGMLRHIGMLRRQILGMLASEGVLLSLCGVVYGLSLGAALSLVLVYVVNRQSFNWSIDLAVPLPRLLTLGGVLIGAAALTAVIGGRAALGPDAVRAVREDW